MTDLIDTPKPDKLCFAYCGDACDCSAKDTLDSLTMLMQRSNKQVEQINKDAPAPYVIEPASDK